MEIFPGLKILRRTIATIHIHSTWKNRFQKSKKPRTLLSIQPLFPPDNFLKNYHINDSPDHILYGYLTYILNSASGFRAYALDVADFHHNVHQSLSDLRRGSQPHHTALRIWDC